MTKYILKIFTTTIVLFLLFSGGVLLSFSIPTSAIKDNLEQGSYQIEEEGLYPVSFGNKYSSQAFLIRDQYSDCIMLNIAAAGSNMPAAKAAITAPRLQTTYGGDRMAGYIRDVLNGQPQDQWYDWYWHGYLVALRPLLVFFNYEQLRWFNTFLFLIVLIFTACLIAVRIEKISSILFLSVLAMMHIEVMPYTLMYTSIAFGCVGSIMILLSAPDFFNRNKNDYLFFFIIGAWTVYVDLLSTPVLTLGIPLVIWLHWKEVNGKVGNTSLFRQVIYLSIMWGAGYAVLWMAKWGLCALTYDPSVLVNAVSHAEKWSGNDPSHGRVFMTLGVVKKYIALFWSFNWIWVIIMSSLLLLLLKKTANFIKDNAWLLLIACIPIVWSLVLVNHTYVHFGFAWRQIGITLLALCFWMYKSIDWKISLK